MAGDFTGDGQLDLAVADPGGPIPSERVDAAGQRRWDVPARRRLSGQDDRLAIVAGDFTGDGKLDLAVATSRTSTIRPCCWATAMGRSSPRWTSTPVGGSSSIGCGGGFHRRRTLDLAVADDGLQRRLDPARQRRRDVPAAASRIAVGANPGAIVAGRFHRRRQARPGRRQRRRDDVSILLGNGDGTFQPAVQYSAGLAPRIATHGGRRLQRRRPARPGHRERLTAATTSPSCWATATARSSRPMTYACGTIPTAIVAGDFTGDGKLDLAVVDRRQWQVVDPAGQRRRDVPARGDLRCWDQTVPIVAGDFTGDGKLDLAVARASAWTTRP